MRILLVDEDDRFRKMVRFGLDKLGFDVVEARNNQEALKLNGHLPSDVLLTEMRATDSPEARIDQKKTGWGQALIAMPVRDGRSRAPKFLIARATGKLDLLSDAFSQSAGSIPLDTGVKAA